MRNLIACEHCDLLMEYPVLNHAQQAHCLRCGNLLMSRPKHSLQLTLSFITASIILFMAANFFPMISAEEAGFKNQMRLLEAAYAFFAYGEWLLGFIVFCVVLLLPFTIMLLIVYLLLPMIFYRRLMPKTNFVARLVFSLQKWSMVDVYLVAMLASITKLTSMVTIELGVGIWAYIAFSLCLSAALANLDKQRFWRYLDKIKCHQILKQQKM
ncbi:paraquat-inducible protein A [Catenovulum agarivorans]|uniref:paraquat-inducible protein A n=1 Tax=Catenovulum agarivorans TaxID=1172192 RepID=UPI000316EC20|nr:paraquat-inducible protein A [Catenovulum agarivorans]